MKTSGCPICGIPWAGGECVRHSGEEIGDYCREHHLQRVHQVPGGFLRPFYTRMHNGQREYLIRCDVDGKPLSPHNA
jgi:hypothetical protein